MDLHAQVLDHHQKKFLMDGCDPSSTLEVSLLRRKDLIEWLAHSYLKKMFIYIIYIIHIYTPVFKNIAISKHVYHIYNYNFSAPVSFLSAPEKTYSICISKKKFQVMATPRGWCNVCPPCLGLFSAFIHIYDMYISEIAMFL